MKLLLCLLVFLLCAFSFRDVGFVASLSRPTAGGGSCPADGSPDITGLVTNDDEDSVSQNTDRFYVGQKAFSDATTRTVCKVGFYMNVGAGDVSGKFYRAAIYSVSGDNLGSVLANGISDQIAGVTTAGWKDFAWSGSKPVLTGSTSYHIVVYSSLSGSTTPAAADTVNRAVVWADTPSTSVAGSKAVWNEAGVIDVDSTTYDSSIRLYWYD